MPYLVAPGYLSRARVLQPAILMRQHAIYAMACDRTGARGRRESISPEYRRVAVAGNNMRQRLIGRLCRFTRLPRCRRQVRFWPMPENPNLRPSSAVPSMIMKCHAASYRVISRLSAHERQCWASRHRLFVAIHIKRLMLKSLRAGGCHTDRRGASDRRATMAPRNDADVII